MFNVLIIVFLHYLANNKIDFLIIKNNKLFKQIWQMA